MSASSTSNDDERRNHYTVKQLNIYGDIIMHLKGKAAYDFVQFHWGSSLEGLKEVESEEVAIAEWKEKCLPLLAGARNNQGKKKIIYKG